MGLNLSLKGQRIIPKVTQKREIKCERTENKSLQSIYTLARLASSSSRVRRTVIGSTGPTIMDFMQCINFKSRLDREREMIRRKIRSSSTLYRKPSFSKASGFNSLVYNGEISKISCITKNIKIGDFKEDSFRKVAKSPLFLGDENEDENTNEGILCIGSKYLDVTSNTTVAKPVVSSTLCLINNELLKGKQIETDFEKAISQSHLSPSSSGLFVKKQKDLEQFPENSLAPPKNTLNDDDESKATFSSENGETLSPSLNKRKDHNKIIKKGTHLFVGLNVGKYSDAQKTDALENIKTHTTPVASKAKKSGTKKKSSSHSKKLETKSNSPKMTATPKSEIP